MIKHFKFQYRALTCAFAILISGCANKTKTPATPVVAAAANAIESANNSGGEEYAPVEMKIAKEKMTGAQQALKEKNHAAATDLAKEAELYALRAEEKADSGKALSDAKALREYIQILLHELSKPKSKH